MRLSLAHHPVCALYDNHTLNVLGIKICLGCTALYSGMILGLILAVLGVFQSVMWEELVVVSFIFFLPTILRLLDVGFFTTTKKSPRFIFRFNLGLAIIIGIISIFNAPSFHLQVIQFVIGLSIYIGIGIKRLKYEDSFSECRDCVFTRSPRCPGFKPFHGEINYPSKKHREEKKDEIQQESVT